METPHERTRMVELQLESRGIGDRRILDAFLAVARERFVPDELRERAYDDVPLPIGEGQTISQPYIVARTVAALDLAPGDRVLEVGTGSGYAAAILAQLARDVSSVERLEGLARLAQARIPNVAVRCGDGSLGWPERAPFDAIAVAAGGPVVPQALLDQLAVGGRLVMPVTSKTGVGETLVRIRRVGEHELEEEELEPVHFVPLIGAHAHGEDGAPMRVAASGTGGAAARLVREVAEPLDDHAVAALAERVANARVVLLGESTHGTAEFYGVRAQLTQRLLERHGFDFVAVEADWPDAESIDAYVRPANLLEPPAAWAPFARFPTWMWRNVEVSAFTEWLRAFNAGGRRVGFHGLDLYSMYASVAFVLGYLDDVDPDAAARARDRYGKLLLGDESPETYALHAASGRAAEADVIAALRELYEKRLTYAHADGERFFDASQNARLVAAAERYYRTMFRGAAESWNLRDNHMFDTLRRLLARYGARSKGIVWAHNSHVGDARATEMTERAELNLGQLCRQALGAEVRIVGFATDHGSVLAADRWDDPGRRMALRPGRPDSYEHVFHASACPAFVLSLREARAGVREELGAARLLRAIGVVYRPATELRSHYLLSDVPAEFDELVWVDETHALTPLAARRFSDRRLEPRA